MLESPSLLLQPWTAVAGTPATGPPASRRSILDPASGRPLGFVGRREVGWPWGLRWLARPVLDIHETEDESLLFLLHGPWLLVRAWEVFDAEEHLVGSLRADLIRDRYGRILAVATQLPNGSFHFPTPEGIELATLHPTRNGCCITFGEDLIGDPFARMLLLAGGVALTDGQR